MRAVLTLHGVWVAKVSMPIAFAGDTGTQVLMVDNLYVSHVTKGTALKNSQRN